MTMRITPRDVLAGIPAIRVRNALKSIGDRDLTCARLQRHLDVDFHRASAVMKELQLRGWIFALCVEDGQAFFELSEQGKLFREARATKPLRPKSCERILRGFLDRVTQANGDPSFLWRVRRAVLYGGLAAGLPRIRQIDLGLELERREQDDDRYLKAWKAAVDKAMRGRALTVHEQIRLPIDQLLRHLKGRHWSLQIKVLGGGPEEPNGQIIFATPDDSPGQKLLFETSWKGLFDGS